MLISLAVVAADIHTYDPRDYNLTILRYKPARLYEKIQPKSLIVDAGVNTGEELGTFFGKKAIVIGFEPIPAVCESQKKRFAPPSRLYCGVATSEEGDPVKFYVSKDSHKSSMHNDIADTFYSDKRGDVIDVPTYTVSERLPNGTKEIFLLQVDTQGNELYVLKGVEKFLSNGGIIHNLLLEFAP
jgi:FkbM family methyltransferase